MEEKRNGVLKGKNVNVCLGKVKTSRVCRRGKWES